MFGREPVAITAAIRAVILAAVLFGLDLSPAQIGGIMLAVEAILALVTRSQTVATTKSDALVEKAITMPSSATLPQVIAAEKKDYEAS